MNHFISKYLSTLVFLLILSGLAHAGQTILATKDKDLRELLTDVPCITLRDHSPIELFLEATDTTFEVSDSTGLTYRSTRLKDALDGYLRRMGVCIIDNIAIKGSVRISQDAIRYRIKTARGDIVHTLDIRKDIEEIFSMGYFENCNADFADGVLTFAVQEYPVVISIEIKGNKKITEEKILEAVAIKNFDILNTRVLKTSTDRIEALYREKGYYQVGVTSSKKEVEGGIALSFEIDENKRLYVKKVLFDGNHNISAKKIRKVMETKTRWLFGFFSHSGSYIDESIDTDLLRIEQYYGDNGYVQAKVGRPLVEIKEDKGIFITIPIEEGPLFHIGKIDVQGDLLKPKKELLENFGLAPGDVMSNGKIHLGIEKVRDIYMDEGYAYVKINPLTNGNPDHSVDLTLNIKKGNPVHIKEIAIQGNTKTRDKVIRRELKLDETDLFSSSALKNSQNKLSRLGYFSQFSIDPIPQEDDTMSLLVNVEEQPTGAFSFGVAYSSVDKVIGTLEVSENNIMGTGLKTKFSVEYGKRKKNYIIDFEEPWLLDYPVSVGLQLYNKERDELYYTKESRGGNIRASYPLFEEVRHYIAYKYEEVTGLTDIDSTYEYLLDEDEIDGWSTSSITNTIYRDTTNDYYRPTRGSDLSFSVEYAGLGGDYHYTRTTAKAAKFFPIYKDTVALMFKLRWGTINGSQGEDAPLSELFTLGGLNTIRGFKYGEIGPRDNVGNVIGGRRMLISNTEITFPIGNVGGLSGVLFYDTGNAYNRDIDISNLKQSYGGGIRWVTPMGPLRLEYGKVINPEDFESSGRWDFTIGTFF